MKIFSLRHPALLLIYYILINCMIFTLHPIILAISFIGVISYLLCIHSLRFVLVELGFYSVIMILITIMYASFAHNGITPLFFYNDHAVTKEAVLRGSMLGLSLMTLALWFKAYLETMQTNHFLYLFTKIHPKLGLFCAMLFRFFPYYKELWLLNKRGQQGMHYFSSTSRFDRLGRWCVLHIHTFTQAVDAVFWKPAIMHSKGYQKQRTQFQLFKWQRTDSIIGLGVALMGGLLALSWTVWQFDYFPALASLTLSPLSFISICAFFWLPAIIEGKELIKWRYLQSKI